MNSCCMSIGSPSSILADTISLSSAALVLNIYTYTRVNQNIRTCAQPHTRAWWCVLGTHLYKVLHIIEMEKWRCGFPLHIPALSISVKYSITKYLQWHQNQNTYDDATVAWYTCYGDATRARACTCAQAFLEGVCTYARTRYITKYNISLFPFHVIMKIRLKEVLHVLSVRYNNNLVPQQVIFPRLSKLPKAFR